MASKIEVSVLHKKPELLLDIPASDLSYEMCQVAVFSNPMLLKNIPLVFIEKNDGHIAKLAVGVDGMAIAHLDPKYLNQEICEIASKKLKKNNRDDCFLAHIPYSMITEKICIRAVKHNKNNIDYVPLVYLNDNIGEIVMSSNDNYFLAKLPLLMRKNLSQRPVK